VLVCFPVIDVLEELDRVPSPFVKGYKRMMVCIPEQG